ncbi:PD-(D/E)XK nuclease family protein [Campylobacter devanensis]|uniref:PDDEXK-like family protein n=1 Tax=Campylobacter devanensis TaxID=3161138 RepID=UPI000A32F3ED|nr:MULTISPECIES: PD-(D/E)XK nuclease family protein [unclassified Campylobacter]
MTEFTQEQYQEFFDEFEKAYKEYENKVKERRARGIHDYNVFDVLEAKEIKHSKFIASLLDPKGLHYQGDLFLNKFIEVCGIDDFGLNTLNSQVYREYKNIDIYITDGNKHIIIENKIWNAYDQDKQIYRYIETIKKENSSLDNDGILVLYLTPHFDKTPSQESLNGFKIKDGFLEKGNDKIPYKHIICNDILKWLNKVKIEIINLTDLNVLISQYEKAVKNLINGEKMENNLIIEQIKKNYKLCAAIHDNFESAKINLLNELFSKVSDTLKETIKTDDWEIESHKITKITQYTTFFSAKLNEYNGKNHDGNYIYYCIESRNGYNNIFFGLVRSNEVKNRLDNDCFKDIVQESDYCTDKSWKSSDWWAWCYKKFSNADDLILDYLSNEKKFISEIRNDLENLKDVLEKLNKKLMEQLNKNL